MASKILHKSKLGPSTLTALASSIESVAISAVQDENEDGVKPFHDIPTVRGWPMVGSAPLLVRRAFNGSVGKNSMYYELLEKYGPIYRMKGIGSQWTVVTHSPQAAAAVYRAEGRCPSRGRLFEDSLDWIHKKNNWSKPMAFAKGEDWKRLRKATSQQATQKWANNWINHLCVTADNLTVHLRHIGEKNDGRIEDIHAAMTKWAFQGTALYVLGDNLDVYSGSDNIEKAYMESGIEFTRQLGRVVSPFPVYRVYPTKNYRDFVDTTNKMRKLGKEIMERRLQKIRDKQTNGVEGFQIGVFEQWIRDGTFSPEEVITQCCDLLAAGFDATANTSSFMLFELAKQPTLQEKIFKEIRDTVGERQQLISEDLQKMHTLRECVRETLRMYPSVAVAVRDIDKEVIIHGHQVPPGTTVLVTMGLMSHDRKYFDEPMRFKPERWRREGRTIQAFSCLPFGFGSRACYGRRFAEVNMYTLLFRVISKYKLTTEKNFINVSRQSGLIPTESVPLKLTER